MTCTFRVIVCFSLQLVSINIVLVNNLDKPDNMNTFSCPFCVNVSKVAMSKQLIKFGFVGIPNTQHCLCYSINSVASAPLTSVCWWSETKFSWRVVYLFLKCSWWYGYIRLVKNYVSFESKESHPFRIWQRLRMATLDASSLSELYSEAMEPHTTKKSDARMSVFIAVK